MISFKLKDSTQILIDEEDLDLIVNHTWYGEINTHASKLQKRIVMRVYRRIYKNGKRKELPLGREILKVSKQYRAVPKNGDYLDFRKENLIAEYRKNVKWKIVLY